MTALGKGEKLLGGLTEGGKTRDREKKKKKKDRAPRMKRRGGAKL